MNIKLSYVNKVLKFKIYFTMSEVLLTEDLLNNKFITISQTVQYMLIYIFLFKLVFNLKVRFAWRDVSATDTKLEF